jgi:hypothetical protein
MDSFNLGFFHYSAGQFLSNLEEEKIVAKLTQSPLSLLFFCNIFSPKNGQKKREQNTKE